MNQDDTFLRRAIVLAKLGRGRVEPNPMVGCVIVRDGRIVGEGFHEAFGGPHAEPNALNAMIEHGESSVGATAYVTLEPCCHANKNTPPCAPRLIAAGVARVVIGCLDPNPQVNGHGVAMLRAAGIGVDVSEALNDECRQLIAPFAIGQLHRRPYVTLKWAKSADGRVAGPGGMPVRITGPEATLIVHALRTRSHAIVVGPRTVITDNPSLTARDVDIIRQPRRFVLARHTSLPETSTLFSDQHPPAIVIASLDDIALEYAGMHVLVEPGPVLAEALLPSADRLWVFESPDVIGLHNAPQAAEVPLTYVMTGRIEFGRDTLTEYLNTQSPAFFANTESADLSVLPEPRV